MLCHFTKMVNLNLANLLVLDGINYPLFYDGSFYIQFRTLQDMKILGVSEISSNEINKFKTVTKYLVLVHVIVSNMDTY